MSQFVLVLITFFSFSALAHFPPKDAQFISEKTENGIITRTYVQESLFDEHQYCYQLITVQYSDTEEFLSSDTEEICNRIR